MNYTYKEVKRMVLSLIGQYTLAGENIPLTYNNQEDYVNQIAFRINEARMQIRTTAKPETVQCLLQNHTMFGGMRKYRLPDDCAGIQSGSVIAVKDGHAFPAYGWHTVADDFILVPNDGADYLLTYQRMPAQIPADAADDFPITEDPDVMQAAVYFAAAQLVRMDSAYDYAALNNEYNDRLQRMAAPVHAEIGSVMDVNGWRWGGVQA